jgi:hypothetical protein
MRIPSKPERLQRDGVAALASESGSNRQRLTQW